MKTPISQLPGSIPAVADPALLTLEEIDRIFIGTQRVVFEAILSLDEAVAVNRSTTPERELENAE